MNPQPVIGVVGIEGAYGRWLRRFFRERMGLEVIGRDPAAADSPPERELIERADVLVFSAPIRRTVELIGDYVRLADGCERGKLWLDVTSIKAGPVAAMLESQAEVAGLHPMTAPPKAPTLKGRVMVVCEARLERWRDWLQALLLAMQAECVRSSPEHHDRVMALVQAMVHASHLLQAGVLRDYAAELGDLQALLPYRSTSFEMDSAVIARILSLNPAIYEDIQFGNPYVPEMLDRLDAHLAGLRALVQAGDDAARAVFRRDFLQANHAALGATALDEGNYNYERLGYLLADLTEANALSVHLPEDRPGSLRALLHVFERHGVSLSSVHSSRTPEGEVHFRIGFSADSEAGALADAVRDIEQSGLGRVLAR
ncbi:prephenate dehydrogenase [Pseudoxanthomonas wuyuanensis]|uniref:Prephenate dehydrogenase n=1 Tax=Pseudoxanthomonas wuyuanensis TaxID=1073196 RepID=A0A286CY47_9GAMM|nr:prephenate dehydrogenase [Pseudoxanthomonas wuyuanensis]KAF1722693.1 prephenate dehydrogenase [Pseudoxanthomonas wuyuanensis]SOD51336.1 prephenate dehydrogenase [Pseudoxanthomonas wuyuanensis]